MNPSRSHEAVGMFKNRKVFNGANPLYCLDSKTKKPLSQTPVEEPKSCELRLPHSGSGSGLTA